MLRALAVVAACVGVNASPLPARPVGTLSEPFWGGEEPKTTVKAAAHKSAPTVHKAAPKHSAAPKHPSAPKHSLNDTHEHSTKKPPTKHTLADGHTHSSPELVQPTADQAQLPARKLTKVCPNRSPRPRPNPNPDPNPSPNPNPNQGGEGGAEGRGGARRCRRRRGD